MVDQLRFFAGAARHLQGAAAAQYMAGHESYVRREPLGVVGAVTRGASAPELNNAVRLSWSPGVSRLSASATLTYPACRRERRQDRPAGHRPLAVAAFDHGYHGRTNLTMALTAKALPYKLGFGPFAPEVYRAPLS